MEVYSLLPAHTKDTITQARQRKASDAEILSYIYQARLGNVTPNRSVNLHENPEDISETIDDAKTMQAEYGNQWEILNNSRKGFWNGNDSENIIHAVMSCMEMAKELKKRIIDDNDPLYDSDKYTPIFAMTGPAWSLFWEAEAVLKKRQYQKAERLFTLFTHPDNGNGFTKGGAYFFLGKIHRYYYHDVDRAFRYFMRVHTFPACLVYTSAAYLYAAEILRDKRQHDNALALLAMEIPNIDYSSRAVQRHMIAADICLDRFDYTNAIRHFQAALIYKPELTNTIPGRLKCNRKYSENVWKSVATNVWGMADIDKAIVTGLTNQHETPDDELFSDALLHEWPVMTALPVDIATNRVLNNNIFPQKRKKFSGITTRRGNR